MQAEAAAQAAGPIAPALRPSVSSAGTVPRLDLRNIGRSGAAAADAGPAYSDDSSSSSSGMSDTLPGTSASELMDLAARLQHLRDSAGEHVGQPEHSTAAVARSVRQVSMAAQGSLPAVRNVSVQPERAEDLHTADQAAQAEHSGAQVTAMDVSDATVSPIAATQATGLRTVSRLAQC